jgi:hypothetical protein
MDTGLFHGQTTLRVLILSSRFVGESEWHKLAAAHSEASRPESEVVADSTLSASPVCRNEGGIELIRERRSRKVNELLTFIMS